MVGYKATARKAEGILGLGKYLLGYFLPVDVRVKINTFMRFLTILTSLSQSQVKLNPKSLLYGIQVSHFGIFLGY